MPGCLSGRTGASVAVGSHAFTRAADASSSAALRRRCGSRGRQCAPAYPKDQIYHIPNAFERPLASTRGWDTPSSRPAGSPAAADASSSAALRRRWGILGTRRCKGLVGLPFTLHSHTLLFTAPHSTSPSPSPTSLPNRCLRRPRMATSSAKSTACSIFCNDCQSACA